MKIGILGGGQLGRMLAEQATRLGVEVLVVDPQADCSASAVAPVLATPLDSPEAAHALEQCDVVTHEFEGVPLEACRRLETRVPLWPSTAALEVVRDRLIEKSFVRDLGIATAEFLPVSNAEELAEAVETIGFPSILKTRKDGYDGKGQWLLKGAKDVPGALEGLGSRQAILEAFVPFDRELSLVAVRDGSGTIEMWAPPQNVHVGGILRISTSPANDVSDALLETGRDWLERICTKLDYRGVLAVELFEAKGQWLVNEMACRVHNSGHWTLDGAETSQFENHVRAVLGMPLGSTASRGSSAMINLIGSVPDERALSVVPDARLYDYGKAARPLRKLGHVNLQREDDATRDAALRTLIEAIDEPDLNRALSAL